MQNRREFLFAASAAAAMAAASAPKGAFAASLTSDPAEVAKQNALFDLLVDRQLRRSPETATSLGVDKGDRAWTKSALSDFSLIALKENGEQGAQALADLRKVDRSKLAGLRRGELRHGRVRARHR